MDQIPQQTKFPVATQLKRRTYWYTYVHNRIILFLDVPTYVYMNKHLKTDAAGIPHRSLDSYQHSSPQVQALRTPYGSFTSSGPRSCPSFSPPKPPRSYSSDSNHPCVNCTSSTKKMSKQSRESHNIQSSDSSSNQFNSPGAGSSYKTALIAAKVSAKSARRPAPPPPQQTSSDLYNPVEQDVNGHKPDQQHTSVKVSVMCYITSKGSLHGSCSC